MISLELTRRLLMCETDLEGVRRRFSGDDELYLSCLTDFLVDSTVDELNEAIAARSWDSAFTAAHALKGLAGNMGFVPLFHASAELVVNIRSGRLREIELSGLQVNRCYSDIVSAIRLGSA